MKFKAIRFKKTGEFATIEWDEPAGEYIIYTHDLPRPQPMTATLEGMKEYFEAHGPAPDIDWNDYEMITLECKEIPEE